MFISLQKKNNIRIERNPLNKFNIIHRQTKRKHIEIKLNCTLFIYHLQKRSPFANHTERRKKALTSFARL